MFRIAACSGLILGLVLVFFNPRSVQAQTVEKVEVQEIRVQLEHSLTRQRQLQVELDELRKLLADERQQRDRVLADMQKKIDSLQKILAKSKGAEVPEPFGKVTWVNQKSKTIWINLGSLDKINPEQQFQIRSADIEAENGEKGVVTVTRIIDKHLSEARILKQATENPILPGDQLFRVEEKAKNPPIDGEKEKTESAKVGPRVDGSIAAVSTDGKHVEVSLGEDDGLRKGMQLEVFRTSEKRYVGRIVILKTAPNRSVGRILPEFKKGAIRKGDRVSDQIR